MTLLLAWVALVALLVVVGEVVRHVSTVQSMDDTVTNFVVAHRTTALNDLMKVVTWAGTWYAVLVVALVVGILVRQHRLAVETVVIALVAWFGELLAVSVAKSVVRRPRPPPDLRLVATHGWSFPSGHTANAVVVFAVAAMLVTLLHAGRVMRLSAWVLAVIFVGLVGFSRIELGAHWLTDVLASAIWTTAWIVLVAVVSRRVAAAPAPSLDV